MYVMNYYLPNQSKEFSHPFSFCTQSFDELKSAVATAKANNYTITSIIREDSFPTVYVVYDGEEVYLQLESKLEYSG